MEELRKFLNLLIRHRIIISTVPIITVILAFFLVRNLADSYVSQAQISTGIVDDTQSSNIIGNETSQQSESKINQQFSNLMEMIRMKRIVDQVSYKLMLHDLTSPKPFRTLSKDVKELNANAREHAIDVYSNKYLKKEELNLWDKDQTGLYRVLNSMNYDDESLKSKLSVYRNNYSDFINIEFSSENPELSAFVANTICSEFVNYYTTLVKENKLNSVKFLSNLLQQKNDTLNNRIAELKQYKIHNRILNLDDQSSQMYTQIGEYEQRKQQAEKDIAAYKGVIANIDRKFSPKDRQYYESAYTKINQDFIHTRNQLGALTDAFIKSGFEDTYQNSIDSLKDVLTSQIDIQSDKYINNPMSTKQALIQQKLTLQIQYDLALYSISSLNKVLSALNAKYDKLVPHEAVIQSFTRKIDISSKEYLDVLAQYNQVNLESGFAIKLRQIQLAMPGGQQPSKKMLLVILSGIISLVFCILVFFGIFFIDNRITIPQELVNKTKFPVLGYLGLVSSSNLDLKSIWKNMHSSADLEDFKNQLRSIRFEISQELNSLTGKGQILSITSLNEGEGKTLLAASLAYSYLIVNKKVLLIDGNFTHPSITETSQTKSFIEEFIETGDLGADFNSGILILGNQGGDKSLLEVNTEELISSRFEQLKSQFDIILIETPSLNYLNKAKEWMLFSDKVIGIFEANQSLNQTKKQHLSYLHNIDKQFIGWVMNKIIFDSVSEKNNKSRRK